MGVRKGVVVVAGAAVMAISLGAACSAAATATTWTVRPGRGVLLDANHTGTLTILPTGGTLHWYHVHDCGHLTANGDPATLSAAYMLVRPQTIASP